MYGKFQFQFNRDLNRGCLVYIFSLRFSGSKFLINLRRQFGVRKIFRTQVFAGFACILCLKLLYQKCVIYVVGYSCIKTCSFNHDLNHNCLVYMFSLRFSGSIFLINLRRQFRVRKILRIQVFAGFTVLSFGV